MAGLAAKIGISVVGGLISHEIEQKHKEHKAKEEGTDIDN